MRTAAQVARFTDLLLARIDLQEFLLRWFLGLLRCDQSISDRVLLRWKWDITQTLVSFAPYGQHCLRVHLLYYTGMMQGIFGTRSTNIVDLQYLCYTPFSFVFCSSDKLHRQLAPFVLRADQSFVDGQDMQKSLIEAAAARKDAPNAQPEDNSMIRQLWLKHWNKPPPQPAEGRAISKEDEASG